MRRDSIFYHLFRRSPALVFELIIIVDMVITIISYRFDQISRREVEKMLDITFEETRVYQEVVQEATQKGLQAGLKAGLKAGRREGRQEGEASLITRQLRKRFNEIPEDTQKAIEALPLTALEDLGEALLDFSELAEVQSWLDARG